MGKRGGVMSERLTDDELAALDRLHQPFRKDLRQDRESCRHCFADWPCTAACLLADNRALREARDDWREQAVAGVGENLDYRDKWLAERGLRDQAVLLLAELVDPDPCWWDHNKNCQAHAVFGGDGTCPHDDAKKLLAAALADAEGE